MILRSIAFSLYQHGIQGGIQQNDNNQNDGKQHVEHNIMSLQAGI
jgi:hypothetical protein